LKKKIPTGINHIFFKKQRFVARTKTLMELRDKDEPTGVSSGI
jgi:hypothetical protein